MTVPGPDDATTPPLIAALGSRSVALQSNSGVINTGDHVIVLPAGAFRRPEEVAAPAGTHNLPMGGRLFVGREAESARLREACDAAPPGGCHVVHGLGGVGKSSLVLDCLTAWLSAPGQAPSLVWWINAESEDGLRDGLARLARQLQPATLSTPDMAAGAVDWARGWLQSHDDWVLVLDNAEEPALIARETGQFQRGHRIGHHPQGRGLVRRRVPAPTGRAAA